MRLLARFWRNPDYLIAAAYIVLMPYLWTEHSHGWRGWLLAAFLLLLARAIVIDERRA